MSDLEKLVNYKECVAKYQNFLNRLIDGTKIEKEGFTYKYENPFDF